MALALSPQRAGRVQRLWLPLLLYIGMFIASDRLVSWLHLPLPANIRRHAADVGADRHARAAAALGQGRLVLAAGGDTAVLYSRRGSAVVNYGDLLRVEGWRICVVIAVST
ncbi:putative effector of murein hydrolase LrgA|nr:putative effector of murein hydrolase LrgA [Candidatus Pantoea persica]